MAIKLALILKLHDRFMVKEQIFRTRVLHTLFFAIALVSLASCAASNRAKIREQKIYKVIKSAKSYKGTPYRYGGTSRSGMDCSGLLLNAYKSINFSIPRSSMDQSKVGEKVGIGALKPGDWVFFATGKKRKKVTHVGLVTSVHKGEVRFIHASSSRGVVESNLSSDYYKKRFVRARRPF